MAHYKNPQQPDRNEHGTQARPVRRGLVIPAWLRLFLYPIFQSLLLIPALRRWRRDARRWRSIRCGAGATAAVVCMAAVWTGWWWVLALAAPVLLGSLFLKAAPNPDRERELQHRHGADYLLNGGRLAEACPEHEIAVGTHLSLLLRRRELLLVRADAVEASATVALRRIEQVLVEGEPYRPVYVSEAKDPPVREESVDQAARAVLTLVLAGGERLAFEYQGAFSRHLAESAAHAIYSVQKLESTHGVAGESPEVFHIVGR